METTTETSAVAVSILSQEMIPHFMDDIVPLISEAVENSEGIHSMDTVVGWINSGQLDVWVAVTEDGLQGCALTEVIPVEKGLDLNVPYAGFKKNLAALNEIMRELIRVSKESGYNSIRFISSDERFGAFAKRHGLRRRFIEYVGEH